ncbi:hypothetical protein HOH87_03585 [bacterium]|jgi:hypothetical protein|nr:hypothetical protein [bacterium]
MKNRLHTWIFWIVLPGYGILLSTLLWMVAKWKNQDQVTLDDSDESIHLTNYKTEQSDIATKYESSRQIIHKEMFVQSYQDILKGSDARLKQSLISKLIRDEPTGFYVHLKAALNDPVYNVRTYAAIALSTIEKKYTSKLHKLTNDLGKSTTKREALTLELITISLDYIDTGMVSDQVQSKLLKTAQGLLSTINKDDSQKTRLLCLPFEARIAYIQNDRHKEIQIYEQLNSLAPELTHPLSELCQDYLEKRNFSLLVPACKQLISQTQTYSKALDSSFLWSPMTLTD